MPYFIDSDILVDYLRHIEPAANYLDSLADWSVSVITGLELIAGAKDKREVAEILVLGAYHVVPSNPEIGQLAYAAGPGILRSFKELNIRNKCVDNGGSLRKITVIIYARDAWNGSLHLSTA